MSLLTSATYLTLARLAFLPLIMLALVFDNTWSALIARVLYGLGALTDFADGIVARKFNQITPLGTFLDPIVDKVYVAALFVMLIAVKYISGIWIVLPILILTREFLISGLREFLGPQNVQFPVTNLAKWKTTTQMIAIGVLLAVPLWWGFSYLGLGLLIIATSLTVYTGWEYFQTGLEHMQRSTKTSEKLDI